MQKVELFSMFTSTHKLEYLQGEETEMEPGRTMAGYKVGTCHGLVCFTKTAIEILAVENEEPGNGHFDDVLEWFEYAAKEQGVQLRVIELLNQRLKWHLIDKRGFIADSLGSVFKRF